LGKVDAKCDAFFETNKELKAIIVVWPKLPSAIRLAMLVLARAAYGERVDDDQFGLSGEPMGRTK
jgi:hypothetical protein